jgi:NADPH2 dehydrogenase
MTNVQTEKWGGSIEKRNRFVLEVTKRLIEATGDPKRVGLRFSPWATGRNMRMADPIPQFSNIFAEAKMFGVAYFHLIKAQTRNTSGADAVYRDLTQENDPFAELWNADGEEMLLILSGGYDKVKAAKMLCETYAEHHNLAVSFGRLFISNPELPIRYTKGFERNPCDRSTFYASKSGLGYTDYPFSEECLDECNCSPGCDFNRSCSLV